MKFILEFLDFSNRESSTRTKSINKEEFLEILKNECSQFSFDNDQLYRKTNSNFGKFGLFMESERKGTIGKYSYSDFFDNRKGYPVPRYKSLIGSTTIEGSEYFGSTGRVYLVIPFNNSEIVFAGSPDLALWSRTNEKFRDGLFTMKKYKDNFKVPLEKLESIRNTSTLSSYTKIYKYGFEFFTNANCLLIDINEIEWLKNQIIIKESWDINKFNRDTYKKYITYDDLNDIMFEIIDEFLDLEWYVWNSKNSSLLKDKKDDKSFIIELVNKKSSDDVLYYLEPKIWNLISNISNKLESYNLYVSGSDFGESDTQYEIVISEIGHKPKLIYK